MHDDGGTVSRLFGCGVVVGGMVLDCPSCTMNWWSLVVETGCSI